MPKFLFRGSYTADGIRALGEEGAQRHRERIEGLVRKAGGRLESLYWAFGDEDLYLIADLPDAAAAGGVTLAIGREGLLRLTTTFLETAEHVDAAFEVARTLPASKKL